MQKQSHTTIQTVKQQLHDQALAIQSQENETDCTKNQMSIDQIRSSQEIKKIKNHKVTIKIKDQWYEISKLNTLLEWPKKQLIQLQVLILKKDTQYECQQQNKTNKIKSDSQNMQGLNIIKSKIIFNSIDFYNLKINPKQIKIQGLSNLNAVNFSYCTDLQKFSASHCDNLFILSLTRTKINQVQINKFLKQLPNLRDLNLQRCQSIKSLRLKKHQRLQKLNLGYSKVSQLCINKYQNLRDLVLTSCSKLKILRLTNCDKLKCINLLTAYQINQIWLQHLSKLKHIRLNHYNKSLQKIYMSNCKSIQRLVIQETKIRSVDLNDLPSLNYINLNGSSQLSFLWIVDCQNVKTLLLQKAQLSDIQLLQIFHFNQNIQQLNLHGNQCIQDLIDIQCFCLKLRKLNLRNTKINEYALNRMNSKFLLLQQLNLQNCWLSVVQLYDFPYLKKIKLDQRYVQTLQLSRLNISQFQFLNFKRLKKLQIVNCSQLKKISLFKEKTHSMLIKNLDLELTNLPVLQNLTLTNIYILQEQLNLNDHKSLQKIIFMQVQMKKLKLEELMNLSQLRLQLCLIQILQLKDTINLQKIQLQYQAIQNIRLSNDNSINLVQKNDNMDSFQKNIGIEEQRVSFQFLSKQQKIDFSCRYSVSKLSFTLNISNHFNNLKVLSLARNRIRNLQIIGLITNEKLQFLNLSQNHIFDLRAFTKLIKFPQYLNLKDNKLIYDFDLRLGNSQKKIIEKIFIDKFNICYCRNLRNILLKCQKMLKQMKIKLVYQRNPQRVNHEPILVIYRGENDCQIDI